MVITPAVKLFLNPESDNEIGVALNKLTEFAGGSLRYSHFRDLPSFYRFTSKTPRRNPQNPFEELLESVHASLRASAGGMRLIDQAKLSAMDPKLAEVVNKLDQFYAALPARKKALLHPELESADLVRPVKLGVDINKSIDVIKRNQSVPIKMPLEIEGKKYEVSFELKRPRIKNGYDATVQMLCGWGIARALLDEQIVGKQGSSGLQDLTGTTVDIAYKLSIAHDQLVNALENAALKIKHEDKEYIYAEQHNAPQPDLPSREKLAEAMSWKFSAHPKLHTIFAKKPEMLETLDILVGRFRDVLPLWHIVKNTPDATTPETCSAITNRESALLTLEMIQNRFEVGPTTVDDNHALTIKFLENLIKDYARSPQGMTERNIERLQEICSAKDLNYWQNPLISFLEREREQPFTTKHSIQDLSASEEWANTVYDPRRTGSERLPN